MIWAEKIFNLLKRETSSGNYIPEIDGLRFLAVFLVILYHIQLFFVAKTPFAFNHNGYLYHFFDNGFKGVEIFFVISGFILALPFAKHFLKATKKPILRNYYFRRLTRLEPPYFLALVIFFILHIIKGVYPIRDLVVGLIFNLLYIQNFAWFHIQPMIGNITWTLEIEVQFYLLAPLLAEMFSLDKIKRRLLLVVVIFGLPIINTLFVPRHLSLYGFLHYFLIGFLVADLYIEGKRDRFSTITALFSGLFALFTFYFLDMGVLVFKIVSILMLNIFIYLALTSSIWRRILSFRVFTIIGGMCYTIYLFHTVVISGFGNKIVFWKFSGIYEWNLLTQTIMLMFPILIISILFFILVEKPCMNKNWPHDLASYLTRNYLLLKQKLFI